MNIENKVPYEFNPDRRHPLYLIRKSIYNGIVNNKDYLKGRLLDFGCGTKPYESLFSHVDEYTGVEYKGEGHDHVDSKVDIYYDGRKLPLPDASFDSILTSEVFEHLFNLEEIILELHRVLKPGGKILITCPFVWYLHEKPVDFARYTPFALEKILSTAGLKVIKSEKSGTWSEAVIQMDLLNRLWANPVYYSRLTKNILLRNKLFDAPKVYQGLLIRYMNWLAGLKSKFYRSPDDFYLTNIVVAEKPME